MSQRLRQRRRSVLQPRRMKPIPIAAAKRIAKDYGYDQVVVLARRVGDGGSDPHGEHVTTYGVNEGHCSVAASIGRYLRTAIKGFG